MENKNPRFNGKKSCGVCTSVDILAPSSSLTESENDIAYQAARVSTSGDADHSLVSLDVNSVNELSDTDTNLVLYEMKTIARKGQSRTPCKVEFCQVNRATQRRGELLLRNSHYVRSNVRDNQHHNSIAPSIVKVSSPKSPEADECYQSSDNFLQPRSIRSKMRNMFSFLKPHSNHKHDENEDAIEVPLEDDNAEFYYFDHGSSDFYRTTDCPPHLIADIIAQRTTNIATKFWAEFFASLNIVVTFIITFFLQFYRFILYSIFRAIIVGFLRTTSDYLLKPLLAVIFNGLLQPLFVFFENIFQSVNNMVAPLTRIFMSVMKPLVECLRAFKLVDVKNLNKEQPRYSQAVNKESFQGQSIA